MTDNSDHRVSISARFNIETLAGLALFLESKGRRPVTRSALLFDATELFLRVLIENELAVPVESKEQALHILNKMGLRFVKGTRANDEIVAGLSVESLLADMPDTMSVEDINQAIEEQLGRRKG